MRRDQIQKMVKTWFENVGRESTTKRTMTRAHTQSRLVFHHQISI